MSNLLLKELEKTRKRYAEAKRKKDSVMMGLWLKVGKNLKRQLEKRGLKLKRIERLIG